MRMNTRQRSAVRITYAALCLVVTNTWAFSLTSTPKMNLLHTRLFIRAPPASGYADIDDEQSYYPDTYDPMMEYPGTMRPGNTPENQPFSSLPIQESDPDPVPWPHFQEIEWHHNWGSPHEHAIPMEDFIDMNERWATAEMEAEMRAGARRGVRERRELEEAQKAASFILDDDEEDDEDDDTVKLDLGQGVEAFIGTDKQEPAAAVTEEEVEEDEEEDEDEGDDFLLDLGLDGGDDDDDTATADEGEEGPAFASSDGTESILEAMQTMIEAEDESTEESSDDSSIDLSFDDLDLDFGEDEEEEETAEAESDDDDEDDAFVLMDEDDSIGEEEEMIPLDDMIGDEDMGDDDEFDDGGFDYD